jgi:hypothetical protein
MIPADALRRHARTVALSAVGVRGLAALLDSRAALHGQGEVLRHARRFAERAGLRILPAAERTPGDVWIAADESGEIDGAPPAGDAIALAISGRLGVAVVFLSHARATFPCARCRLAAARAAAGPPLAARGALAVAAGARLASVALAARLPERRVHRGESLDEFPRGAPLPRSLPLLPRAGCACAGGRGTSPDA